MSQCPSSSNSRRRAVFLDRDGTLIEDRGHLRAPCEVAIFPDTVEALKRLQPSFQLFIVTNQSGVAKGALSLDEADRVNKHVVRRLAEAGVTITDVYVCPHQRSDGCLCMKPKPYFLAKAAEAHGIDLRRSFVVGDHPHDVALARRAGACGICVLTGHGEKHLSEVPADAIVAAGISGAAERILALNQHTDGPLPHEDEMRLAGYEIKQGGVVAFPTETVYGLGADALNAEAVARIFEIKRRPAFDPLIVHVASERQAEPLVTDFPADARALATRFWPGPLTIVLLKAAEVPDITTAGLPTVAVRAPAHPVAQVLIREAGVPIAAPSANLFGKVSPTTAAHVRDQLSEKVDLILDGGPCSVGIESTIVSFAGKRPVLLRPGGLPVEDIEAVLGPLGDPGREEPVPLSPGRLRSHYAPQTPVILLAEAEPLPAGMRVGLLCLKPPRKRPGGIAVEPLSESGDLREAAANLFSALRRLDTRGLDLIAAEPVPEVGLGRAIMDRLRRASIAHSSFLFAEDRVRRESLPDQYCLDRSHAN